MHRQPGRADFQNVDRRELPVDAARLRTRTPPPSCIQIAAANVVAASPIKVNKCHGANPDMSPRIEMPTSWPRHLRPCCGWPEPNRERSHTRRAPGLQAHPRTTLTVR
jgi:hypothetical protein